MMNNKILAELKETGRLPAEFGKPRVIPKDPN